MRHRSTALSVITFFSGALLTSAPATAATETCQGSPATIVGTGTDIQGTEGDDVVVTGTSIAVYTYGGNDLVCVTASTNDQVWVTTGVGNDVVDASAGTARRTVADVGVGIDRYIGSPEINSVTADGTDDTFDAATGNNLVTLRVNEPVGDVMGSYRGSGADMIVVHSTQRAIGIELDDRVTVDGITAAAIAGFHYANVQAPDVVLRGNGDDNYLSARGCNIRIDGASGDDSIVTSNYMGDEQLAFDFDCPTKSRLAGGPGDDTIRGRDGRDRLVGNGGNDELQGGADADLLFGGGGRDNLDGGASRDVLRGNGGDDTMDGGFGPDLLLGNRGRDNADGHQNRDRCDAERERRCER